MEIMLLILAPLLLIWMWYSNKKRKTTEEQLNTSIQPGRDVVLRNGSVVTVLENHDDYFVVEVSEGYTQRWIPGAISRVLPDPYAEALEEISDEDTTPGMIDGKSS